MSIFIPELHFSSHNGLIELSSINISADFLEVKSGWRLKKRKITNSAGDDPRRMLSASPSVKISDDGGLEQFHYPELVASLNLSLNPCDNFYNFVCDGWMRTNQIDEDKTSSNQFQLINNLIEDRIKGTIWDPFLDFAFLAILDDRKHFRTLAPYDSMMFTMFDACMVKCKLNI